MEGVCSELAREATNSVGKGLASEEIPLRTNLGAKGVWELLQFNQKGVYYTLHFMPLCFDGFAAVAGKTDYPDFIPEIQVELGGGGETGRARAWDSRWSRMNTLL